MPMPMWPWDPIVDAVTAPFKAAAGWAWDTVIGGITDWLAKGFVQLVSFVWEVMDRSTSPAARLGVVLATPTGAPYLTAVAVATGLLLIFLFCALIQGVLAGRPMELVKRMAFDTPVAVAGILFTVAFTQVGIDLVDAMSDGIWSADPRRRRSTRSTGCCSPPAKLTPGSFLTPLLLLIGMLAMLMLWIVLFVREALIYLVVALAPMAWATSVWPAIASVRRRVDRTARGAGVLASWRSPWRSPSGSVRSAGWGQPATRASRRSTTGSPSSRRWSSGSSPSGWRRSCRSS